MKNRWMRIATVAVSAALAVGMMTGCGSSRGNNSSETEHGDEVLFSYDGVDVSLKEAWVYAKMTGAQYDSAYGSYYGTSFWTMSMGTDADGHEINFEDYVKQQVVSQIKQIIVLDKQAEELGLSLSDEEVEECKTYATAFVEDATGKGILSECGGDQALMEKIYQDNALASKVQEDMVKDVSTDISDDEARESKIYRVVFETTKTDDDGNTVDMTDKEKAEVLKKAEAAYKKITEGTSIEDIASEQEYTSTDETFAKGESAEGEAFEALLPSMKDGDMVEGVQECDNGYVIAKLVAYTDEEATKSHKESIISSNQQSAFSEKYSALVENLEKDWTYETSVNQDLWAEVKLAAEEATTEMMEETTSATEDAETATTEAK